MEIVTHTAIVLNCLCDGFASAIRHILDANNYCVSLLIDVFTTVTNALISVFSCVYLVLYCCLTDFIAFLNELGVAVKFVAHLLATAGSNITTSISDTCCFFGYLLYCMYSYVNELINGFVRFVTITIDLAQYFLTLCASALLLILQAIPNTVEILCFALRDFVVWITNTSEDLLIFLLQAIYKSRAILVNTVLSIPPKSYLGLVILIVGYHYRSQLISWFRSCLQESCHRLFAAKDFVFKEMHTIAMHAFLLQVMLVVLTWKCFLPMWTSFYRVFKILLRPLPTTMHMLHNSRLYTFLTSKYSDVRDLLASLIWRTVFRDTEPTPPDVETLQRQLTEERDKHLCVVCQDRERTLILLPCSHFCLCQPCFRSLRLNFSGCPLCRKYILDTLTVYA